MKPLTEILSKIPKGVNFDHIEVITAIEEASGMTWQQIEDENLMEWLSMYDELVQELDEFINTDEL